jgi:pimeloyl-ACP methyl ester carboxylesterase
LDCGPRTASRSCSFMASRNLQSDLSGSPHCFMRQASGRLRLSCGALALCDSIGRPACVGFAAALAQDALDLIDRLGIERCSVIGHDWGARTGYALAALESKRIQTVCHIALAFQPRFAFKAQSFEQSSRFWYQFFMCSEKGMNRVIEDHVGFSRYQ